MDIANSKKAICGFTIPKLCGLVLMQDMRFSRRGGIGRHAILRG